MMMLEIIYDGEVDSDDEDAGNDDDYGYYVSVLAQKSLDVEVENVQNDLDFSCIFIVTASTEKV